MGLREEIIAYLETNYDEETLAELTVNKVEEYIDDDDWKDQGYQSKYDCYLETHKGEAENDILNDIKNELMLYFSFSEEFYFDEYGETLEDLIKENCDQLNTLF